jgi:hypothetical protein
MKMRLSNQEKYLELMNPKIEVLRWVEGPSGRKCYGNLWIKINDVTYTLGPGTLACRCATTITPKSTDKTLWDLNFASLPQEFRQSTRNNMKLYDALVEEVNKKLPTKHCGGCYTREMDYRS